MKTIQSPTATGLLAAMGLCLFNTADAEGTNYDSVWREARNGAIARIINPDDYQCEPSVFDDWFSDKVYEMGVLDFYALLFTGGLDLAFYRSFLFAQEASTDIIGVNGEYTKILSKRHKDNQRFWDVPTGNIQLRGLHGTVLADDAKMVETTIAIYQFEYGEEISEAEAQELVDLAQAIVEGGTEVDLGPLLGPLIGLPDPFLYTPPGIPGGYNHPFLSLDAFASWTEDEPEDSPFADLPDTIVMGDGLLEAFVDFGIMLGDPSLANEAPEAIHAHEFAHHVTNKLGVFDGSDELPYEDLPEATRRTELMADAFGAYYCAHARGASFQAKRFVDVVTTAYSVGDCEFDSPGHHGTPNQREAASLWGGDLAQSAKKQGHIKSAWEVLDRFEDTLPELVAPEAP